MTARQLWLAALDREAVMDDDSALALLRLARQKDPRFLPAHVGYMSVTAGRGRRRELRLEYEGLAAGGDPFFACLVLAQNDVSRHSYRRLDSLLSRLDERQGPTACSAYYRFQAINKLTRRGRLVGGYEGLRQRALRYAPEGLEVWTYHALTLWQLGLWDQARAAIQEEIRASPHPMQRLWAYAELARLEREAGATGRAAEIDRALGAAVARDGRPRLRWDYDEHLAWGLLGLAPDSASGAWAAPEAALFERLKLARQYGSWSRELTSLFSIGILFLDYQADLPRALHHLNRSVELADSVGSAWHRLKARRMRGRIYSKMGRLREAERDLLYAIEVGASAEDRYELGEAYHNLAHVYEAEGRLADASRVADRWIATVDGLRDSAARIMAYRDAGMIRWKAGWHAAARSAFEAMVRATDDQGQEYHWAGEFLEREGDLEGATAYYRLSARLEPRLSRSANLAGLARVYEALGFSDSAETAAREHDQSIPDLLATPLLPRILARRGRAAEAISLSRAWAERRQDQQNVHGTAVALLELAQLLVETGRASEALVEARRAEHLALDYTLTDELMGARRLVALALLRQGSLDQAVTLLRQTAHLARTRPTARGILETHLDLGNALASRGRVAEALSAYDVAAGAVEKMAWHLEQDLDRARYRERWLDPFEGAVRLLLRQRFSNGRLAELVRWSQRLKGASLARATGTAASGNPGSTTPPSLNEIRGRLGPNEAVIDYLVAGGDVAAIVVTGDSQAVVRLPTPADSIRQWIEDLRSPLVAMYGGRIDLARAQFSRAIAGKLYEALLAPLEPLLVGIRRLTIVPSGALHYVPFDALALSDGEARGPGHDGYRPRRYLVDRYEIRYLPSLQFLAGRTASGPTVLTGERVLALTFQVPGGTAELEAIRRAWPGGRVAAWVGTAASETAARGQLPHYGVVHFAVHAQARDDDPLGSHLLLAGDSVNDGYLHPSEVTAQRLSARLVVLSACETLSGTLYNGEGLMGLARAFLAGGSRAVVATQWPVGSWAADFMAVFYRRLAAGDEPAAALRAAKLTLRENPATADPFFWAGFMLVSLE